MKSPLLLSRAAFALIGILLATGCTTTPQTPPAQVTILPEADGTAAALMIYLQARNVPLAKPHDGAMHLQATPQTCQALIGFMTVARLKIDTCAGNIANANTTRDAEGKSSPYRRRQVVLAPDGQPKVCMDESDFQKRFQPGHPDAGADGMVLYPNIDLTIETMICMEASREYEIGATILRRLDPTVVIAGVAAGDAFEETD